MQRWIQRFTGNREITNAGWLIGGKAAQMALSFFISICAARYLGPDNYGIIHYASAYVAFFTAFCTLGINSVIIKDFVDNPDEQGETIGTALVLRTASSIVSVAVISGIVQIVDRDEPLTVTVVSLCSLSLVFQAADTINYWFQSRYESKVTAVVTLVAYAATSAYKIMLLVTRRDIRWFAFAPSVDYICIAILLVVVYWRRNGPKLSFSLQKGGRLLTKSYHYILSGLMVAIYGQTDKLMLKHMLDEASVAHYSLAASLNLMWVFVLQAIIDSVYPTIMALYKTDRAQFERKNRQLYALVIYVSLFVAVCFTVFGRRGIQLLYGDAYIEAAKPLRIITWYTIFSYLGVARNAWIVCENRQRYLKYLYLGAVVINIVLNWFLIPLWGASGAAAASLATQVMTSIILPAFMKDMRPNVKLMIDALFLRGMQ